MKSRNRSKKSITTQKDGVAVVSGALLASLLKLSAGVVAVTFLNMAIEVGGSVAYYLPVIAAHALIFAVIDIIFFFILKSQNIKYGIKTYLALAAVPIAFFAAQLIFLVLSTRSNESSVEPAIVWLIMSLGLAFLTAAIGHIIKFLPKKSK